MFSRVVSDNISYLPLAEIKLANNKKEINKLLQLFLINYILTAFSWLLITNNIKTQIIKLPNKGQIVNKTLTKIQK